MSLEITQARINGHVLQDGDRHITFSGQFQGNNGVVFVDVTLKVDSDNISDVVAAQGLSLKWIQTSGGPDVQYLITIEEVT